MSSSEVRVARAAGAACSALVVVAALLLALPTAEAAPQLPNGPDGWRYKADILVNSSLNLSDVQVPFALDTQALIVGGKMRSDCGDLRVRTTGTTDLPHWIESGCNTKTTRVWVRAPSIVAGSSVQLVAYYGNPDATSAASLSATFVANGIRVEVANCASPVAAVGCPIVNHSTANAARDLSPSLCAVTRTKVEYGYACNGTAPQTNVRDFFATEYRFLFVPDVSGVWRFETRSDNRSELALSVTDDALVTSRALLVTNYGDDRAFRMGNLSMTAGQARWFTFVSSDDEGAEEQTLRVTRPGGVAQTLTTANFPDMIYRRNYPSSLPFASLQPEVAVLGPPSGSATPFIERVNLSMSGTATQLGSTMPQPGSACRIETRAAEGEPWTSIAIQTADSNGQCIITASHRGLANNTTYAYRMLFSKSGLGDGVPLYLNATTWGPPTAGTMTSVTSGNRTQSLAWVRGVPNGASITGQKLEVSVDGAPFVLHATLGASATSHAPTGLTNGARYDWRVIATSDLGDGPASNALGGTPSSIPNPPVVSATAGNRSVTLTIAPGYDQGSPITAYRVWNGTQLVATVTASTVQLMGLANGYTYAYNVTAQNANGWSASSNVATATPGAPPDPPAGLTATPGNGTVSLAWTPGATNGAPLTGYRIWNVTGGGATLIAQTSNGANTSFVVNGLANGYTYSYHVTAVNAFGQGNPSNPASARPATVPYPPNLTQLATGNHSITLWWTAPTQNGGEPVQSYRVYEGTSPTMLTDILVTANTSVQLARPNGQAFYYRVSAINAVGEGATSNERNGTPVGPPYPPRNYVVIPGNRSVTLQWDPPLDDGGRALTQYILWTSWHEYYSSTTFTSATFTNLVNGQEYSANVRASNGMWSNPTATLSFTPASIPDPPLLTTASRGDGTVALAWTPGNAQGSPIQHYKVYRTNASGTVLAATTSGTTWTDSGLTNGVAYTYSVTATNGIGTSVASNALSATPAGVPAAPDALVAQRGNRSASLSWTPPSSNGEPLLGYDVYVSTAMTDPVLHASTSNGANASFVVHGLENGVPYTFHVRARNAVGPGGLSAGASATPAAPPHPPALASALRGDGSVALAWSIGDAEGSAISATELLQGTSPDALSVVQTLAGGATSVTRTGLANGVTYHFALRHVNGVGTSALSNVLSAKPAGVPGAPGDVAAARANGSASLTWSAPAPNGEPLLGYDILLDGALAAQTSNGANTSFTLHGLTNGQTYALQVRARNVVGAGAASAVASATPAGAPYPPTLTSATRGDGQVALSWTPGAANGDAITATKLLQGTSPDALAVVATLSPSATNLTRTGLTNGVTYHFALLHENDVGAGNASNVLSAKPATTPGAPSALSAARGNRSATLTWSAGATGGEPLLGYDILLNGALLAQTSSGANTSFVAHGLQNGVEHAFHVRARNVVGTGALSSEARATPAAVPHPPQLLTIARGDGQVTLSWANGHDEGSALTSTRILMGTTPGSYTELAPPLSPSQTSYTRTGLTNGVTYYFALRHTNAVGTSGVSNALSAKPATTPDAPSALQASFGDGSVALTWSPPGFDGGEPVTSYTVHAGANESALAPVGSTGTNTSYVVGGLSNGVTYSFRVVAGNAVGVGPASAIVQATPARAPDAPAGFTAQAGSRQVLLDWSAPGFDGGRAVSAYRVYRNGTLLQEIGTNSSYTAAGLVDGVAYRFRVSAVNLVGEGASTVELEATPISSPGAPASLQATTLEPSITLQWTQPTHTGGAAIQQYRIYASTAPGAARWLVATVPGSQLSYVDDAEPATARHYVVRALNAAGEGPASPEAMGATPAEPTAEPTVPDTYRSCTRDPTTRVVACTDGSSAGILAVAAGGRHTCALLADHRVDCWGDDASGQSGDHLAGADALRVSAGASHTCVLLANGNVDCYGNNAYGKAASYLGGNAAGVASGGTHTCFLLAGGAAVCQGSNAYGQSAGRAADVAAIAAGSYHTCFLLAGGAVDCQGLDDRGQAADDATGDVVELSAGRYHTCARTTANGVRCWGDLAPVPLAVQGGALAIASGRDHACALVAGGNVVCWGATRDGQSAGYAGGDAVALAAGDTHGCVLRATGTIACWGAVGPSDHGQAMAYPRALAPEPIAAPAAAPLSLSFRIDLAQARPSRPEEA